MVLVVSEVVNDNINGVEEALNNGASPDSRNADGNTALMVAAKLNRVEAAKKLVEWGARKHLQNPADKTAYDFATTAEMKEVVKTIGDC